MQNGAVYQIYEYPRTANLKRELKPRRALDIYVILKDIQDGLAQCEVLSYEKQPSFLPALRKGLKLSLPQHFLKSPKFKAKLARYPQQWLSQYQTDRKRSAKKIKPEETFRKLPPHAVKATLDVCSAYSRLIKPKNYIAKPGQVWVNTQLKKRITVTQVNRRYVTYQDQRLRKFTSPDDFVNMLKLGQYRLEVPQENIIKEISLLLQPYLPINQIDDFVNWLIQRLGLFSVVRSQDKMAISETLPVTAHLTEELKTLCKEWLDVFMRVQTYEEMVSVMDMFIKTEQLEEEQKMYAWQYINELRFSNGERRL